MQEAYRIAASALVFRPAASGGLEVLLLHKPRKRDAWQLPQGGAEEGESVPQTAMRELQEEASLTDVEYLGTSEEVYQYDFPASFRRFRPDHIRGQRINYIFLLAKPDAAVIVDGKEVDDFLWIKPDRVHHHIRRKEYLALVRRLLEEGRQFLPANLVA